MGAHDALGALVAQRSGFDGVWSSGFELAASRCVPDAEVLTMAEQLAVAESMAHAVSIPVVADCDTGYGNAESAPHMIRSFEDAGVAGVCIEDKRFPKLNSFAPGSHELVSIAEFTDKVRRAKAAQRTPDFVLVARVEALIAGRGPAEALERARAYADAGADAVLVHSREEIPSRLLEVVRHWDGRVPLVVVPTTYHTVTAAELEALGVKVVIYANHGLRSSLRAMEEVCDEILRTGSTSSVESRIASVSSVLEASGTLAAAAEREASPRPGRAGHAPMTGEHFCGLLRRAGYTFFSGVPDSTFGSAFAHLEHDPSYLPAPREDLAVGAAAGAWLGGRRPAVLMQSSGLGTSMNALVSLAALYRVPMLVVVGWRGSGRDAPEHLQTGRTMLDVLRAIELPFVVAEPETAEDDVARAAAEPRARKAPVVLLLREGIVR
jgi:phosphoenolpyruvate mutase